MKKLKIHNLINSIPKDTECIQLQQIKDLITAYYSIDKIICFASTINDVKTRNCFGEDNGNQIGTELNNYSLLVIPVSEEKTNDFQIAQRIEEDCKPVARLAVFVHRMKEINIALTNGSSFFTSIYYNGIIIHNLNRETFVVPQSGRAINDRLIAKEKFWSHWHNLSLDFVKGANFYHNEGIDNLAVFSLHQALLHCYSGVLRVLIGYRTNTNGLPRLLKLIENVLPKQAFAIPHRNTPDDPRLTTLLFNGMSDARYNSEFVISEKEIATMSSRINHIIEEANKICIQRISDIKEGKTNYIQTLSSSK